MSDKTQYGLQMLFRGDLTSVFGTITVSMVPASLLIVVTPIYVRRLLRKKTPVVKRDWLLGSKTAAVVSLIAAEFGSAIATCATEELRTKTAVAGSVLSFIGSLCIATMMYIQHMYSYKLSTFLSIFMSFTLIFHVLQARSYFNRDGASPRAVLSAVTATSKALLMLLEEIPKQRLTHTSELPRLAKESIRGFWNRTLFIWLNSILALGFRKIMSIDDLQDIGSDLESEVLYQEFLKNWSKADKNSKHILARSCLQSLGWKYPGSIIPRLCYSAFSFSQPYLFYRVINLVGEGDGNISSDVVTSILWTTVFIYFGIAVSRSYYTHIRNRAATCIRGILATAISDKMLKLSAEESEKHSVLTLAEESLNEIEALVKTVNNAIASVIDIAIGLFVLYTIVGSAAFLLLIPTTFSILLSFWATARMGDARGTWFRSVEHRVAATSRILSQLKSIKIMGLQGHVSAYLQHLRRAETKLSLKERHLRVLIHFFDLFTDGAVAVFVFAGAVFWTKKDQLGAPEIFVTFSAIIITLPALQDFLLATPYIKSMYTCIMSFQEFLLLEEPQNRCNSGPISAHKSLKKASSEVEKLVAPTPTDQTRHSHGYAISVSELSILQGAGDSTLLHNASAHFRTDSVTMMIGQVGCGKSAFLKAILGEASNCNGYVTMRQGTGSIAYCGQTPWLRNASIRENIIGHSNFDALWYKKVIKACALVKDLNQLPNGDSTLTGSGGAKLSGGQKHRVALARAIYSRAPIIILDDIFRALDATTSSAILADIFGKRGIIRQLHATVIITTSSIQHASYADVVLAFDGKGKINLVPKKTSMLGAGSSLLRWLHRGEAHKSDSGSISNLTVKQTVSVDEVEDFERQRGDLSLYTYYWSSAGWLTLAVALFGLALAAVSNRMLDVFVRIWIDKSPNKEIYFPSFAVLGFFSAFIAGLSIGFYYLKLIPKCTDGLHNGLLQTVMGSTLSFISQTETGSVLNRFGQDMTHVSHRFPQAFMVFWFMLVSTIVDVAAFSSASLYTLVLIPLFIVFTYCIQYFYLRTSRQIRLLELEAKASVYARVHESSNGVHHLRAFKWQRSELQHICKLLDRYQKPFYYRLCIEQWLALALDFSVLCIVTLVVALALYFPGSTTQAATGLSLSKLNCFTQGMIWLILSGSDLESFVGSVRRTRKFNKETPVERPIAPPATIPCDWPAQGRIEFASVTAKYGVDSEANANTALRNVSLTIQPGQKVGIMGRTGSGKSSLLLTILNFLDFSGQVRIDGISIQEIPYEVLRTRIITIAQDGVELDGSVRDNINAYSDASQGSAADEMVVDILKRVRLWDKIESSGGLDATLAEVNFSEGQKQLLALGRAILRKRLTGSKIVLVDEATSSIDYETDKLIQEVMADALSDCTTVTVAHRLQSLESADLVLEMESGSIRRKLESDSDEWQSLRRVSLDDTGDT